MKLITLFYLKQAIIDLKLLFSHCILDIIFIKAFIRLP